MKTTITIEVFGDLSILQAVNELLKAYDYEVSVERNSKTCDISFDNIIDLIHYAKSHNKGTHFILVSSY